MKVTVLGTGAAYPGPGEACSGFLVEDGDTRLLVDCGIGVLSTLQKLRSLHSISHIVITHMHADHFFDLVPYRYALRYDSGSPPVPGPRLYLPPDGIRVLNRVVSPFAETGAFFSEVFDVHEYDPAGRLSLGSLVVGFAAAKHYIPTYALSVLGARKVAYTSDSGVCPGLLQVAGEADLLICNAAACLGKDRELQWGHMTPGEAGTMARQARAKRVLLSHLWPSCDRAASLREASEAFRGAVELAESCRTYHL